jgi:peptidoglycan/xylan/chitin deacetylase (PgdA/CDA1 family)
VLIVLYHRVVELPFPDPYSLCVSPQHFAEHLEILHKSWRTLPLQQLAQALYARDLPYRAVVVTFDDGYADNLYNAKPLLERYAIPATLFVATGAIGCGREFWWDELARLFLQPGTLPEMLHLNVNGISYQWEVGDAAHYSEADCRRDHGWNLGQDDTPSMRQHLHRSLYRLLHALPGGERRKLLDELVAWAGRESVSRPTHRILSGDEVVRMAEGGLVEVGSHTVTHPVLTTLPLAAQREEIRQSKASLEDVLGRPVASLSYPHGSYTSQTAAFVREAGFACACSSRSDLVWRGTDCFQLPRMVVENCNGEVFTQQLKRWIRS